MEGRLLNWGKSRWFRTIVFSFAIFLGGGTVSNAGNLTKVLERGLSPQTPSGGVGLGPAARDSVGPISAALSGAVSQAVTQQFPLASISPAFTYRLNERLGLPELVTEIPGPLFAERALTLGKGQWNFSAAYAYLSFDDFNGTNLSKGQSPGMLLNVLTGEDERKFVRENPNTGNTVYEAPSYLSITRSKIDVQAHVVVPSIRYGLTDNWDVGITIPIVNTSLRVRSSISTVVEPFGSDFHFELDDQGQISPSGFFDTDTGVPVKPEDLQYTRGKRVFSGQADGRDSATGIGDITLRMKYRLPFLQTEKGGAAAGLNLLVPSGDEDDFHGTGDVRISPFLFLSNVIGDRFEPHLNVGFEINANDIDRTSFLYTVGVVVKVWKNFALMVDFIGRTEFEPQASFPDASTIRQAVLDRKAETCTDSDPCHQKGIIYEPLFLEAFERNDIMDFAFGLRYILGKSGSVFFGGIIPLNDDGFRSDFIPAGGLEYTF